MLERNRSEADYQTNAERSRQDAPNPAIAAVAASAAAPDYGY
jgi:hypothetical protein